MKRAVLSAALPFLLQFREAVIERMALIPQSTVSSPASLETTLADIRRLFSEEAFNIRSNESVGAHGAIRGCLSGRNPRRFKRAHELLEEAEGRWRNGLASLAEKWFHTLCRVAAAHPDWVTTDSIQWARAQIESLTVAELDGKEPFDLQWTVGDSERVLRAPSTECSRPGRHLQFYRFACEGGDYDPPRDAEGRLAPWRAPVWVTGHPNWSDERASVYSTKTTCRLARTGFERRVKYMLDHAEQIARIDLIGTSNTNRKVNTVEQDDISSQHGEDRQHGEYRQHGATDAAREFGYQSPSQLQTVQADGTNYLGQWADELLPEMRAVAKALHACAEPDSLRSTYPRVFADVLDPLPVPARNRFYLEARLQKRKTIALFDVMANVKELKGTTLRDLRTEFRRKRKSQAL